ncbi:FtsX-like permease family protein [Kribbella sp. NPDC055071]
MGSWGPPLRIARRTTRRQLGRTLLVAALIGLPVLAATGAGVILRTSSPQGETLATTILGQADAVVGVTQYGKLENRPGEPSLSTFEAGPPVDAIQTVRTPSTFDPTPLLPPGSTFARMFVDTGMTTIRTPGPNTSATLITGDGMSPLTKGTVKLDHGRLPATKSEVAISPSLADRLGLKGPSGTVVGKDGRRYDVVGIARQLEFPRTPTIFATSDTPLRTAGPGDDARYLVKLPASVDTGTLESQLLTHGLFLLPRANVVHPPPDQYDRTVADFTPYAVMALAIGFGLLEIVLLAGTAFAVGARRQTRELGLVLATGGTPRDVRRIVLLQGVFAGVVGVIGGLSLAAVAVLAGKSLWERITSKIITGWQIPWSGVVAIAAIGLLSGLAAAVVPAIAAGKQPPMAALSGRFAASAGRVKLRLVPVVLLAVGVSCALVGTGLLAAELRAAERLEAANANCLQDCQWPGTPTVPIAMVFVGITATIVALVWLLPSLIAACAALGRRLPLSARMAVRDAGRHRHRTGPAAAAIMMAVAATAAAAFVVSNAVATGEQTYTPMARSGDAILPFGEGNPVTEKYSPHTVDQIAGLLPVRHTYELGTVSLPKAKADDYGNIPFLSVDAPKGSRLPSYQLLAVDPAYVARFDQYGANAATELRAGKVVLPIDHSAPGKSVLRNDERSTGQTIATVAGGTPPKIPVLHDNALISTDAAHKLGTVTITQVQYELTQKPTKAELAAVARVLGADDALRIEAGYKSSAWPLMAGVLGAATIVTLLGVAISVSLSAAEGRADLATLAAIGAQPRRRRSLAAAQAWVLGQLGCLLGVGVGALFGYTAHAIVDSPQFMVPWAQLAAIVVAVPLFAGLLAWLMTRSTLPMVARID